MGLPARPTRKAPVRPSDGRGFLFVMVLARRGTVGGEDGAVVEHEPGIGTSVRERGPHSALNTPITEADLTEWPDPYDHREDPRDPGEEMVFGGEAGHTQTGATSTSEPHPSQDPEAEAWEGPKRDKVDQ